MKNVASFGSLALLAASAAFLPGCPNETNPDPDPETPLEPPPEGQGLQIRTGPQPVDAGIEAQNCFFYKVGDLMKKAGLDSSKPLNLNRVQIAQSEGSHHFNVFRVRTITPEADGGMDPNVNTQYLNTGGAGACFKSTNWADWPLIANSQIDGTTLDWTYPDGVANELEPDEWIMLQSHFVNASTQKTPDGAGEVFINLWHMPESDVKYEMGTLFATKQSIRVCQSNPNPTYSGSCQVASSDPVTIVGANGHFHSRGKQFEMFTWDGQSATHPSDADKFYSSQSWEDPDMSYGDDLADIPKLGGVFYDCSYQWTEPPAEIGCDGLNAFDKLKYGTPDDQLDCCYTFGPQVDRNEHCNIFVYYYPKSADVNCF
jgi:hypothetical protein